MTETIFLATPNKDTAAKDTAAMYPEYGAWYNATRPILEQHCKVVALDLPDIWVRDFLPMQNAETGKLYQLFYNPIYRTKTYAKHYEKIRIRVRELFPNAEPLDIRMDGGNLITNGKDIGLAFWNDAIGESEDSVAEILKSALGLSRFYWLPKLPTRHDPFCHIDGFAGFVGDNTVLTSYSASNFFGRMKQCYMLDRYGLNVVRMAEHYESDNPLSAKGMYANFLETSSAIFVPQYNIPDDGTAIATLCEHTKKKIIGIDCEAISKHGGSLHCLTKELMM